MGTKLVIVESPAKIKTIGKILGGDYVVMSSVGHVRDLPVKTLGVDVEHSFEPKYVPMKGKKKVIDDLKKAADKADAIYLAPDPDREGEAIAWHLFELLKKKKKGDKKEKTFFRVQYNELTPKAVKAAFANPGELDLNRVNAQQARRILDRLVGYTVSPMLWRRLKRGLSAGRVQSVALRLVCEREHSILKFVPEEYWVLGAVLRKLVEPLDLFHTKLTRVDGEKVDIKTQEQAEQASAELAKSTLTVADISNRTIHKNPHAPFITSTLQQAGSSFCGLSPRRTMSLAQQLYEGVDIEGEVVGLITYMRTDSFKIANDALDTCRGFIDETYGSKYLPEKPNFYKSRSSAQEAHEAIRPTDVTRTPESMQKFLDAGQMKLYRLIWARFVASQMTQAEIKQRTIKVEATPPEGEQGKVYNFQATSSEVEFAGYMKVSGVEKKKKEEIEKIPELTVGEKLHCEEWLVDRKETQPPARYSEASLVKALEENGVGRPSTYAQILSTLQYRKYVLREKRTLLPTELGMQVNTLLVENLEALFNVAFTAAMEDSLDEVEKGTATWTDMLAEFYEKLLKWMEAAKLPPADTPALERMIEVFAKVEEWRPAVKRGKRTYDDSKFVASIAKQHTDGKKPVSQRQLETLMKMACQYKDQVPELETAIKETGHEAILSSPDVQPPKPSTVRKLALLKDVSLEDAGRQFVDSLGARVESGRCLSPAQLGALNNVVVSHGTQIEGFEQMKAELEVEGTEVDDDNESGPLLDAMSHVTEWREPITRGKRVFDDSKFYGSLCEHFGRKGFLSPRQRGALKKLLSKYKESIPNFDDLADEFDIKSKKASKDKPATEK
jgi:DNA topoisomerase-1